MSLKCKVMVKSGTSRSIFGMGITPRTPVYGTRSAGSNSALGTVLPCYKECDGCDPVVPYIDTMNTFVSFLESLKASITRYFPKANIIAPPISELSVKGTMDLSFYTRVMWSRKYASIYKKFDASDIVHVNLLKDIFLDLGYDWHIDTWLNKWPNN
jgi:hypothetical protein